VDRAELVACLLGWLVGTLASVRAKWPIVNFVLGFAATALWVIALWR
jgi:hypothetical protein